MGYDLGPNAEVMEALAASTAEGRFAQILLIRYERPETYTDWIDAVLPRLAEVGAHLVWAALDAEPMIGPVERRWDVVAVVEYPSREAFFEMLAGDGWAEVEDLRMTGMVANEIYGCKPVIDALDRP